MTRIVRSSLGYCQFTVAGTAKFLNVQAMTSPSSGTAPPSGAEVALIIPETNAIRYLGNGGTPTASVGMPIASGGGLTFDGSLANLAFIAQSGTATVNVEFYGTGGFNA